MKRTIVCAGLLGVLFCLVWRNPLARVALVRHFWASQVFTYFGNTTSVALSDKLGRTPNAVEAAARFSDDAWWQWQAEQYKALPQYDEDFSPYTYDNVNVSRMSQAAYDGLATRFPQSHWLRTEQINALLPQQNGSGGRQPLPTPTPLGTPAPTPLPTIPGRLLSPPPNPTPTPYAVTESTLPAFTSGLALCDQGERAEPQNTLWNWMRAYCLFSLRRDPEAIATLQQGAHKSVFDLHILEEQRAALQGKQKLNALDWDEKLQLLDSQTSFTIDNRCYNVLALAVEQAEIKERAGRAREALQIYDALTRLLRISRLSITRQSAIFSLSRQETLVLGSNGRFERTKLLNGLSASTASTLTRSQAQTSNLPFVTTASLMASYARAHGRSDFARFLTAEDNQTFLTLTRLRRSFGARYYGLNDDELTQIIALNWLEGTLAWQVTGLFCVWWACVVMLGITRAVIWWRRRKLTLAPPPDATAAAPTPDNVLPIGWIALLLAVLIPSAISIGLVAAVLRTDLNKGVTYQYYGDGNSRYPALILMSMVLAASAIFVALGIGSWGAKRALLAPQRDAEREAKAARDAGTTNAAESTKNAETRESQDFALLTMPDEVSLSWLPLSPRAMRQLCAPFNWLLTFVTPLSWAALIFISGHEAVALPIAYLPGMPSPLITIDAPSWGFSILLTILVLVRWAWRFFVRDGGQWRKLRAEQAAATVTSAEQSAIGSAKGRKKRRVPWSNIDLTVLGGMRDALGVALVCAFALYVALVWAALPLRTRVNARADLIFQVGELKAAQQAANAQATGANAQTASGAVR